MNKKKMSKLKSGITRRQFMHHYAIPTLGTVAMSPMLEGLMRAKRAEAGTSPIPPLVTLNLPGGWGMWGNFVGTVGGAPVSLNTMVQHGIAPAYLSSLGITDPTATMVTQFGAPLHSTAISGFTNGLMKVLTTATTTNAASTLTNTQIFTYNTESPDDNTSGNLSGIASTLVANAGITGLYGNLAGMVNSPSGNGTGTPQPSLNAQNIIARTAGDIIAASAFSQVLSQSAGYSTQMWSLIAAGINSLSAGRLQNPDIVPPSGAANAMNDFVGKSNSANVNSLDPTTNADMKTIWGLGTNINGNSDAASVQASIIFALLNNANNGQAAVAQASITPPNGYDYHGNAFGTANANLTGVRLNNNNANGTNGLNYLVGIMVGSYLLSAAALNSPVAIWLTTDGGLSSNSTFDGTNGNNQYQGDRSLYSGAALIVYSPKTLPATNMNNVGQMNPTSGALVQTNAVSTIDMATAHMFYNLGLLNGSDQSQTLLASGFSQGQVSAIQGLGSLFKV